MHTQHQTTSALFYCSLPPSKGLFYYSVCFFISGITELWINFWKGRLWGKKRPIRFWGEQEVILH